ncbi:rod shape-determining protein [Hyphomicrobium sp. D-2]|uniref:rod shape-determining protein n=1 Tax=Hyphomicrobium sp. D-2 TaxID=3041621 RepID=UPI0024582047|nr:rod shape-determining protein [Hyphomicrobium sp. D-2]MDH4981570.1 rod shape-determining protein [Hyphomicrobium sp. D-2]
MFDGVAKAFSDDIAIDLGTANTLVHVMGRGIIIDEPSTVAVRTRNAAREILAVGRKAKALMAEPAKGVELVHPLREGVIADFVAAEEMLRQLIRRAKTMLGFRRPRILICVPAQATPVERRAVYETAKSLGARKVYLIAEPVAASLGAGLPVGEPGGAMVLDIGGGSSDIAVLSAGEIISARTLRIAGNAMDAAIVRYVRRQHQLHISDANAERMKVQLGTAIAKSSGRVAEAHIRGRDLQQGTAKTVVLGARDIAEALAEPIEALADFVQRALEDLMPETLRDIRQRGIHLTGGGAMLDKLDVALTRQVGVPFHLQPNPMHCVVKGSAAVLAGLDSYKHLLMKN